MKRAIIAAAIAAGLWAPAARADGVPVIDINAIAQRYQSIAQELKDAAVQVQQLQAAAQQVGWAVNTFNSLVAHPNLPNAMGLLSAVGIEDPLPVSPYAIQGLISGQGGISGSLGALSSLSTSAASSNNVYTCTDGSFACDNSRASANGIAGAQGIAQQVYAGMAAHFPVINSLRRDMLGATTPAEREHVQGQLAAEQAWAQNAQGQIQTASLMLAAENENRRQRDDEQMNKSIDGELAAARAAGVIP